MNIIKFLEIVGSNETTTDISLLDWMMSRMDWIISRYTIPIVLMVLCLVWAFYGSEYSIYEPPNITLKWDSRKDLVLSFDKSDLIFRSIEEELWYRGIGRTLIQLDSIKKPIDPLWKDLDLILSQWEQDLNNLD